MPLTDKQLYRVIDDVNSYYRVTSESKKELLLNKYPNAAAAYSLRLLDGYYRGPLVRVRRDSDGAEVDVYPDYNNQLSLDSLVSNVAVHTTADGIEDTDYAFQLSLNSLGEFVGATGYSSNVEASDATVCIWYDQANSDNGNDAIQATLIKQPLIVSGGVIIEDNGKSALYINEQYFIANNDANFTQPNTYFFVANNVSGSSDFFDGEFATARNLSDIVNGVHRMYAGSALNSSFAVTNNQQFLRYSLFNGLNSEISIDGATVQTGNAGTEDLHSTFRISSNSSDIKMQEIVFYNSDQSTNRTGIEEDINDYYQIEGFEAQQPLIDLTQQLAVQNGDTIADGTPAAAYSLRTLSSTYTGPLVRVRRSTDDVEVDVYADSEGSFSLLSPITDGGNEQSDPYLGNSSVGSTTKTKLYEFVYGQSCDLTVVTWYDQASGNNATQATTGNQPKIYDSSTGVITKNGNYAAYSGSGQHLISGTPISNDGNWLALAVAARIDSTAKAMGLQASSFVAQLINYNSTYLQTIGYNGSVVSDISIAFTATTDMKLLCSQLASGTLEAIVNGQSNGGVSLVNQVTTAQPLGIFCKGSASETFNGYISEAILYVSDQSANRTDIEQNINTYYSIY